MKNELSEVKKQISKDIADHLDHVRKQMYQIGVEVMEGGKLPRKAYYSDAGFDLFASEDVYVVPGDIVKHPLKIKLQLPANSWARVEGKSGLSSRGLLVYGGVIDQGYRGEVHAILTNLNHTTDEPIVIKAGEKIAQMTMNPHSLNFFVVQVDKVDSKTERGSGGFGSTGKI